MALTIEVIFFYFIVYHFNYQFRYYEIEYYSRAQASRRNNIVPFMEQGCRSDEFSRKRNNCIAVTNN